MRGCRFVALGCLMLGLVLADGTARAAEERGSAAEASGARSGWAYDLAGELMSPFCPGRTVASCPSPQATELIQWIATQEAAGATREEVVAMLVEKHGEEILGAPPARGITLWAYVFPVLGFVGFGGVAVLVLRRIVGPGRPAAAAAATTVGASGSFPSSDASMRAAGGSTADADELARIVDAELAERA
jgi:cytochrome c-type biogenesis protein CcmH/NrfF